VWKDLNDAEYRRHFYMRERSYASEPGSRIALKLDDEKEKVGHDLGLTTDESLKPTTPSTDALSTLLTEGFLEPKRISLGLAPSEVSAPVGMQSLAPPLAAYATAMASSAASSVPSSNLTPNLRRQHRRQSSTNAAVSWNETVSIKRSPMKKQLVKWGISGMQTVYNCFLNINYYLYEMCSYIL